MEKLHQELWNSARNYQFIPYSGFFESDEFLSAFSAQKFPTLLYAARRSFRHDDDIQMKNWTKLVASLPMTVGRLELDELLDTPHFDAEDAPTGSYYIVKRYDP